MNSPDNTWTWLPGMHLRRVSIWAEDTFLHTAERTMMYALENRTLEEILDIQKQLQSSDERNLDTKEYAAFTNIIGPILGLNNFDIAWKLKPICVLFNTKLRARITVLNKQSQPNVVEKFTIDRLREFRGYETVIIHLEDVNWLFNVWYTRVWYWELMKAFEKLLKKMILSLHLEEYRAGNSSIPTNASMEDILRFLWTLWWNHRQQIDPISRLNTFANDDKHAISQNWNIESIKSYNYNGLISFIITWMEWHAKR